MSNSCGCLIVPEAVGEEGDVYRRIVYCPMHKAADKMLAALVESEAYILDTIAGAAEGSRATAILHQVQDAVTEATPDEGGGDDGV